MLRPDDPAQASHLDVTRDWRNPMPGRKRPLSGGWRLGPWWMLAVLLLVSMLSYLDRVLLSMLADPVKADLNLSDFQLSLLMGPAFGIAYAVLGLPFGWATDRFSRRWLVTLAAVVWSLGTVACGLAGNFAALFAARVGVGASEAALNPAAFSLIADKTPPARLTTALSIFAAGPKWGQALAYATGGFAIAAATGLSTPAPGQARLVEPWQFTFILIGAIGLLAAPLTLTFSEPVRRNLATMEPNSGGRAGLLVGFVRENAAMLLPLLIGFSLTAVVSNAIYTWAPSHMHRQFGWSPTQYGPALGLVMIIAAAAFLGHGLLADALMRRGRKDAHVRYYSWLLTAILPVLGVVFLLKDPLLFLIGLGLVQSVALPYMLMLSATISLVAPNQVRGQVSAGFFFIMSIIGPGLSPVIVGAMTDFIFHDEQKLGWSLAVVSVSGILGALVAFRLALRPLGRALSRSRLLEPEIPQEGAR
jgi:MFS family permease